MRTSICILILLGSDAHAAAPRSTLSVISNIELNRSLELGEEIERRVDGDLNGDGALDTVFTVRSGDSRAVNVLIRRPEAKLLYRHAGEMKLEDSPLGAADLTIAKGVLKIEDLTGGTTAIFATYRLRLDPANGRMRLIGQDATLYSRTFQHDGFEFSWNLLTGDVATKVMKLIGEGEDASYEDVFAQRYRRVSKPVYMEDVPDPEMVMVDLRKK